MRILVWHVHGAWSTAFVRGQHTYLVPVTPTRDADGRGRARTYVWPDNAVEVTPEGLRDEAVDLVVLQRPHETELCEKWLGRRPGVDVPAVYVEHDTPRGAAADTRHPLAERSDIPIVHVTHFNQVYWDSGRAPTAVIEHGVVDPGWRYTGELPRAGVVINEPLRRERLTGADLLPALGEAAPLDVYGMNVARLPARFGLSPQEMAVHQDPPQHLMHEQLARRRVYVHPFRWTSLGLSLVEAMHLGMPVVALAATEAIEAVPSEAGVVSTRLDVLRDAVAAFVRDMPRAREAGHAARQAARERYSLERFLRAWDGMVREVTR